MFLSQFDLIMETCILEALVSVVDSLKKHVCEMWNYPHAPTKWTIPQEKRIIVLKTDLK